MSVSSTGNLSLLEPIGLELVTLTSFLYYKKLCTMELSFCYNFSIELTFIALTYVPFFRKDDKKYIIMTTVSVHVRKILKASENFTKMRAYNLYYYCAAEFVSHYIFDILK